ncbi:MAG: hypothetical protein ACLFQB_14660 [Chitinispirillaceae bacterium]
MSSKKAFPATLLSFFTVTLGSIPIPVGFIAAMFITRDKELSFFDSLRRNALANISSFAAMIVGVLFFRIGFVSDVTQNGSGAGMGFSMETLPVNSILGKYEKFKKVNEIARYYKENQWYVRYSFTACNYRNGGEVWGKGTCARDVDPFSIPRGTQINITKFDIKKDFDFEIMGQFIKEGKEYTYEFEHPDLEDLEEMLTLDSPEKQLEGMQPRIREAIEKGGYVEGMNIEQVKLALGLPCSRYGYDSSGQFGDKPIVTFKYKPYNRYSTLDHNVTCFIVDAQTGEVLKRYGPEERDVAMQLCTKINERFATSCKPPSIDYPDNKLKVSVIRQNIDSLAAYPDEEAKQKVLQFATGEYKGSMETIEVEFD